MDFVNFTIKGERYPLIHTISELRFRVLSKKLGINRKEETRVCSNNRTYGTNIPKEQKGFCNEYDSFVSGFSLQNNHGSDLRHLLKLIPASTAIDLTFPSKYKKGDGFLISKGVSDFKLKNL